MASITEAQFYGLVNKVKKRATNELNITINNVTPQPGIKTDKLHDLVVKIVQEEIQKQLTNYITNQQPGSQDTAILATRDSTNQIATGPDGRQYQIVSTMGNPSSQTSPFFFTSSNAGVAYAEDIPSQFLSDNGQGYVCGWDGKQSYYIRKLGSNVLHSIPVNLIPDYNIVSTNNAMPDLLRSACTNFAPDNTYFTSGFPDWSINSGGPPRLLLKLSADCKSLMVGGWYQSYDLSKVQYGPGVPIIADPGYSTEAYTTYEQLSFTGESIGSPVQGEAGKLTDFYACALVFHNISLTQDAENNPTFTYDSVEKIKINLTQTSVGRAVPPKQQQQPEAQYVWFMWAENIEQGTPPVAPSDEDFLNEIVGDIIGTYGGDAQEILDDTGISSFVSTFGQNAGQSEPDLVRFFPQVSGYYNTVCPEDSIPVYDIQGFFDHDLFYSSTQYGTYTSSWHLDTNTQVTFNNVVWGFNNDAKGNPVLDICGCFEGLTVGMQDNTISSDNQTSIQHYDFINQDDDQDTLLWSCLWTQDATYTYQYTYTDDYPYFTPEIGMGGRGYLTYTEVGGDQDTAGVVQDPSAVMVTTVDVEDVESSDVGPIFLPEGQTCPGGGFYTGSGSSTIYPLIFFPTAPGVAAHYQETFTGEGTSIQLSVAGDPPEVPLTCVTYTNTGPEGGTTCNGEGYHAYAGTADGGPPFDLTLAANTTWFLTTFDGITKPVNAVQEDDANFIYINNPTGFAFPRPENETAGVYTNQYWDTVGAAGSANGYYFVRGQVFFESINQTFQSGQEPTPSFVGRPPANALDTETMLDAFRGIGSLDTSGNVIPGGTAMIYYESWLQTYFYCAPNNGTGLDPQTQPPDVFTDKILAPYQTFPFISTYYKPVNSYGVLGYSQQTETSGTTSKQTEAIAKYLIDPTGLTTVGGILDLTMPTITSETVIDFGVPYHGN